MQSNRQESTDDQADLSSAPAHDRRYDDAQFVAEQHRRGTPKPTNRSGLAVNQDAHTLPHVQCAAEIAACTDYRDFLLDNSCLGAVSSFDLITEDGCA
ncbi:MAG: hypothetical protein WA652_22305, partial [Xanthobacteraceae bacterium]